MCYDCTKNITDGGFLMKRKVGDKVTVKKDLKAGAEYYNKGGTYYDIFSRNMMEYRGREARIVEVVSDVYYKLNIDVIHNYTDEMLEDYVHPFDKNETLAQQPYILNDEVEKIVSDALKSSPQQLIDDALDRGDKEAFKRLTNLYYIK